MDKQAGDMHNVDTQNVEHAVREAPSKQAQRWVAKD
jgi:hypothetical protein